MDASLLEDVLDPSVLFDEFVSANERYTIAARISGVIATAFPEGRPVSASADAEATEDEAVADDADRLNSRNASAGLPISNQGKMSVVKAPPYK